MRQIHHCRSNTSHRGKGTRYCQQRVPSTSLSAKGALHVTVSKGCPPRHCQQRVPSTSLSAKGALHVTVSKGCPPRHCQQRVPSMSLSAKGALNIRKHGLIPHSLISSTHHALFQPYGRTADFWPLRLEAKISSRACISTMATAG